MILSSTLIAGALGAGTLGVSVKTYRDLKRKKEFPWTVAAETFRVAHKPRVARHPFGEGVIARVTSSISRVQVKSLALTEEIIAPFVSDTRREQLQEITASDTLGEIQAQKEAKRNLVISSVSLLFVSAGALFYTPLYVPGILGAAYLNLSFSKRAYHAIVKERRLTMDLLTTTIITAAFIGGYYGIMVYNCFQLNIIYLLLAKTSDHSRKSLVNLFREQPRFVWMVVDGAEVEVPFENVQIGDQVAIVAGQMIPVDGTISAGMASIDQHMLTGEGQAAEKGIGDPVFASTVVLSGKITVRVEKRGSETLAAQIGGILNSTANFNLSIRSRAESFLEKAVPVVFAISAVCLPWLGLNQALAVLWSCPGLRISILGPMSMLNYLHILSRQGILIKDGRSLELLDEVDTIVFDKTGTLTEEMPVVSQIFSCSPPASHPLGRLSEDQVLTYAAAAEYRQSHPIAKAILQAAEMRQLDVPQIDDTHYEVGYGIKVNLNDQAIRVGSERFMEMCGITIPLEIKQQQTRCQECGYSLVYVAIDEQLCGAIELVPTIRPEVKEVILALRESGKTLYIISGDQEAPTRHLAQELGIDHYFANTLPENKAELVKQLQEEGRSICFIGDGINDAIALKQANVSISLRGATSIAMDTAQIVLMDGSLTQLAYIFDIAEEFNQTLDRSFMMTAIPKMTGIAGVLLFHWGIVSAIIFNTFWWLPQFSHAMLPLYKHRETNKQQQGS